MKREELLKLIQDIDKETEGYAPYPIKYFLKDDGFRISVSESFFDSIYDSLEYFKEKNKKFKNVEKFMKLAFYDYDMHGFYYWIPYDNPQRVFTSPAWRIVNL